MVMVLAGQRSAHRPQRMQRVSSFNIAVPVMLPNSAGCKSVNWKLKNSGLVARASIVFGRHKVIGFHGDGVGGTAQRAQTAADAAGLVLQHRSSGDAA